MKVTIDFKASDTEIHITDQDYISVEKKEPDKISELICQLTFIMIKYGDLPVYSSERYNLPQPFVANKDIDPEVPDRVVLG